MIVGVDFDNTIVSYDDLFHREAVERQLLPAETQASKGAVRDSLRASGREDVWTELQGYVYGPGIKHAKPYPGVIDFFVHCKRNNIKTQIISHKTRFPYAGTKYDLHQSARSWLEINGFHDLEIGLALPDVIFGHKKEKIEAIVESGCSYFIDDLPEFLARPGFSSLMTKILFDPNGLHTGCLDFVHASSWQSVLELISPVPTR